jgi:hypothetical protein
MTSVKIPDDVITEQGLGYMLGHRGVEPDTL